MACDWLGYIIQLQGTVARILRAENQRPKTADITLRFWEKSRNDGKTPTPCKQNLSQVDTQAATIYFSSVDLIQLHLASSQIGYLQNRSMHHRQ
jgi:hypothetical protein